VAYFPLSNLYDSLLFLIWYLSTIQIFGEYKTNSKIISFNLSYLSSIDQFSDINFTNWNV